MDAMRPSGQEKNGRPIGLGEVEQLTMDSIQNNVKVHSPYPYENFIKNDGINEENVYPEENRQSVVLEGMPEMFKFTLEDAIRDFRGGGGNSDGNRLNSFLGPVTEAPLETQDYPNGLNSKVVKEYVNPTAYQTFNEVQPTDANIVDREPGEYTENIEILNHAPTIVYEPRRIMTSRGGLRYRGYERQRYNRPMTSAPKIVFREYKTQTPKPTIITSEVAVTEENPSSDLITKSPGNFQFFSWDPSQLTVQSVKVNKNNNPKYITNFDNGFESTEIKRKSRQNALEMTGSYSRQRTQGTAKTIEDETRGRSKDLNSELGQTHEESISPTNTPKILNQGSVK